MEVIKCELSRDFQKPIIIFIDALNQVNYLRFFKFCGLTLLLVLLAFVVIIRQRFVSYLNEVQFIDPKKEKP